MCAFVHYSNRSHFGLIQSMGGGKYVCHVFAEYKASTTGSDIKDLGVTTFSIQTISLTHHNFIVCVFAEAGFDYLYWH